MDASPFRSRPHLLGPRYLLLDSGRPCSATDPRRGVWYSINTDACGYWTDDWSRVVPKPGSRIPSCPECGAPGCQTEFRSWQTGINRHEAAPNPHYGAFVAASKERCARAAGSTWRERYEAFAKEQ